MNDTTKKRGRGRPPIFGKPMTRREIWMRHESKRRAAGKPTRAQVLRELRNENARLLEITDIGRQLLTWYTRSSGRHVVGSLMPLGLHDPGEIARTWERLHALVNGGTHAS